MTTGLLRPLFVEFWGDLLVRLSRGLLSPSSTEYCSNPVDAGSRVECTRNMNRLQNMCYCLLFLFCLFVCLFVCVCVCVCFGVVVVFQNAGDNLSCGLRKRDL